MNLKMVFNTIGRMAQVESALFLLPIAVSLYYRETCITSFILTAVGCLAIGTLLSLVFRPNNHVIYAREGFAIVALVWISTSLFGAVPFF